MLSNSLKEDLHPCMITVVGVNEMPIPKNLDKLKNISVRMNKFYSLNSDMTKFTTISVPHNRKIKFNHSHVIFLGSTNQKILMEEIKSSLLEFEILDREKDIAEDQNNDLRITDPCGIAKYNLFDFLNRKVLKKRIRCDIRSKRHGILQDNKNLDLNSTAKKPEREGHELYMP